MNGEEINRNRTGCDCVSSSETTLKAFILSRLPFRLHNEEESDETGYQARYEVRDVHDTLDCTRCRHYEA